MVDELRRIVEESEIMREDDANWPKKNSTGRQELEVRLGKEHISFEVSSSPFHLFSQDTSSQLSEIASPPLFSILVGTHRRQKSAHWWTYKIARIRKG